MEKLIFLLVFAAIAAVHSWWKKKQGAEGDSEPWPGQPQRRQPPRPAGQPAPPPPKQPQRWEEELRRLLQGDAPKPPVPPPLLRIPAPPPAPGQRPVIIPQSDPDMEKGLSVQMPSLLQSAQAYLRASSLESRVASHMRGVEQQVTTHKTTSVTRQVPAEIRQAVGLVRHRQSLRAAIIASVVLGPPKSLEG
jgi:hypothetical protein